ncbi:MAG: hypothetical protein QOH24_1979 [Verrucomicrobiota bacterium]
MINSRSLARRLVLFVVGVIIGVLCAVAISSWWRMSTATPNLAAARTFQSSDKTTPASPRLDPEQPEVFIANISTASFRELHDVLSKLAPETYQRLIEQFRRLPPGKDTNAKIRAFFKAWGGLNAKAALAAAITLQPSEAKSIAVKAVISAADNGIASSLAHIINEWPPDTVSPGDRDYFLSQAATKWSRVDPVAASKFLDSSPFADSMEFLTARSSIAHNWAALDPVAAIAWEQAHTSGQVAVTGAISGWWEKDPNAAEVYAASHLDTFSDRANAATVAGLIAKQDRERAQQWVSQLANEQARGAAESVLVSQLAFNDPRGAAEWATTLPDDSRAGAIRNAVNVWTANDQTAAEQWVDQLSGELHDEALSGYALRISFKDPMTAANLAAGISDPTIRNQLLQSITGEWLRQSPHEATAWIQNSPLSDNEKRRLLAGGESG